MTAETLTKVSDFLRDAQVRVGQLTSLINSLRDEGSISYQEAYNQRRALINFVEILYDPYAAPTHDGINTFLQASPLARMDSAKFPSWTDREIVDEIDYLRYYGQLSYTTGTFAGYFSQSTVTFTSSILLSLQGFWDPNTNVPTLADTVIPTHGYYYLVINADDGVR